MKAKGIKCSESNCEREAIAHGICRMHYGRVYIQLRTKTYRAWDSMKQRCLNPSFSNYPHYGGRGISISKRWLGEKGFSNFVSDMGEVPNGLTLERIDNDKDYSKANCRWATRKEQARNRRSSRFLKHNGVRLTVSEWSEKLGINRGTIFSRIYKGLSDSEALCR